jgi:hypothetical protein
MPEPLTWTVLQQVAARLQTIAIDDGFHTDLGENVSLEGFVASQLENLGPEGITRVVSPTDSLNDADTPKGRSGPRSVQGEMDITVEHVIPITRADAHHQAHRARADIVRVLRDDPRLWAKGITAFAITRRQILEIPDGFPIVVVQISARARIHEDTPPPPAA